MSFRVCFLSILLLSALQAFGQTVSKEDVLSAVRMSSALIECGYTEEGVEMGQAASRLMPQVDLTDKSEEVVEAFVIGKQAVAAGEVTCKEVLEHARKAGIVK